MWDLDATFRTLGKTSLWSRSMVFFDRLSSAMGNNNEIPPPPGDKGLVLDEFADSAPGVFLAGAARVDITPERPEGLLLAGFDYGRKCTGIKDPLFARALVLWDGQQPLVIVTLDLIGLSLPRSRYIRSLITNKFGKSVLLLSTHNHQAPDTLGMWGKSLGGVVPIRSGIDHGFMEQVQGGIVQAVSMALSSAKPARVHFGQGLFDTRGKWISNERSRVLDRQMRIMHVRQENGAPIATLVQHACHPESLGETNTLISADFCSRCCDGVERALGGVALYVNGSLGAMVTGALAHDSAMEQRYEFADALGAAMARTAVRIARKTVNKPVEFKSIVSVGGTPTIPKDNPFFELLVSLGVVERRDISKGFATEVSIARLGDAVILGLPGEPSPELGLELLSRLPGKIKFIFALANDELGYLMPPEFFWDDKYDYERTMSPGPLSALNISLCLEDLVRQIYNVDFNIKRG